MKRFTGYRLYAQGVKAFLDNLKCTNGKWNYFMSIRALCNWLYRNGYTTNNPIALVEAPKRQKKLLPAISKEQLDVLVSHCHCDGDKAVLNLLWYSGMRLSETANVRSKDFDWNGGTVVVLGKGNKFRKALAGNGIVKAWFTTHDSFGLNASGIQRMLKRLGKETGIKCNPQSFRRGFCVHQVQSGLSTGVVQVLGGWETISMVEKYPKSLTFGDALSIYHRVNGSEV